MIINKHEAASTKVALQDIAHHFGDAVFIISNTRLEGRNVVYFATDSSDAMQAQEAPTSVTQVPAIAPKKRSRAGSATTARKKPAARTMNIAATIAQAPAAQPPFSAVTDVAALEQQLEHLKGLLAETAHSMTQAETVVSSRLEGMELLQRKQKSGIDQLNRRMARQTELLSAILASMESRAVATLPSYPQCPNDSSKPAVHQSGNTGYPHEADTNPLLTYMNNHGSFYASSAFSSGVHAILTDGTTDNPASMQEFARLLGEPVHAPLARILHFAPGQTAASLTPEYAGVATDEMQLDGSIAKAANKWPVVVFMSTRDFLNQAREFKCLAGVRIHCFYAHGSALEQLAFLEQVHRLRPQSLSIAALPRPTRGLPELFSLLRGGLPLLFLGSANSPLATSAATLARHLGNKAGTNPGTIIARLLGKASLAASFTNPCTIVLRTLAGRFLHKMEPADAK